MSAESVLAVAAAPASSPATPPAAGAAPLGAGGAGAGFAQTGGSGAGGSGASGSANGPYGGGPGGAGHAPGSHGRRTNQRTPAGKGAPGAAPARSAQAATDAPAAGPNFSQTLAQSLAGAAEKPAAPSAPISASTGKSAVKPAKTSPTHGPEKTTKAEAVNATMAMVNQAVPQAAPLGTSAPHPAPSGASSPVHVSLASVAARSLAQTAQLTLASGPSAHDSPGNSGTPGSTSAAGNAAASGVALAVGQAAAGAHALAQSAGGAASAALSAPVGSSEWNGQLGAQLTWMARQGVQSASLQVSPQHLGPVQVSISVHHGQASVWFGAAQPETRQALTQALPELRAMFANQGLTLADSGVSHDAPRDSRRPARPTVSAIGAAGASEGGGTEAGASLGGVGLLDTYA